MRKNSLKLPRWIIKNLQHGKENEDLSSIVVGALALYSVCAIAYFAYAPFGRGHLALEVVAALGILAFILLFGFWLIAQVALLDSLRKEALLGFIWRVNTFCISTFPRIGQKHYMLLCVPRSDRSEVVSPARCLWRTGRNWAI